MEEKICTKCKCILPLICFPLDIKRNTICKKCLKEISKNYRNSHIDTCKERSRKYYQDHKLECKERTKKWNKDHPGANRERVDKWTESNRTRKEKMCKKWHDAHKDKRNIANAKWRKTHPLNTRTIKRNRRMKEKNNPGNGWSFTEEQQLITDYDHRCAYCGNKFENLTMDHVIPLSKGGRHEIDNIVPACRFCNGSKHNKPLLIWMLKRMENAT